VLLVRYLPVNTRMFVILFSEHRHGHLYWGATASLARQSGIPLWFWRNIGLCTRSQLSWPLQPTLAEPLMPGLVGYQDPFLGAHKEATTPDGWELILSIIEHTQTRETGVGGLFVSENGGVSWRESPLPVYTLAVQMTGPSWNETSTPTQASRRRRVALNTHAYAPFSLSSCGENARTFV